MAARRRRKPPLQDARDLAARGLDKTAELEVKYSNSFKGRGVFAKANFQKGDFVVEYRGELINSEESQRRRRTYHGSCAVFMFDFSWRERTWCVDAAREDDSLGRLVNDDHIHPNCRMKKVVGEGKPHLCLFALRDINTGEEITYNYGGTDWPWRKQVEGLCFAPESSETDTCRSKDEAPQGPSCDQMQVEGLCFAPESSETDTCRSKDEAPQGPSCDQMQVEGLCFAPESSETDTCRSKDEAPQGPSCNQMQVEGLCFAPESSETDTCRSKDEAPQGPSCDQMQVEGLCFAPESSETDTCRSKDEAPQGPSCNQMQVEGLCFAPESSETDTCRSKDEAPQGPSCDQMQVEGLCFAPESSETDTCRSKDEAPQGPSCNQMQVEGLCFAPESSETDTCRSKDEAPQGPSCDQMQVEGLCFAPESSETDTCRSKDEAPQGPSCNQMQVEGLCFAPESSETDTCRSKDEAPQGPSCDQMQGSEDPELNSPTKKVRITSLVNYTDSDTELDQLADFLGHDKTVHRQFYRLPEGTLQLAKVSKVLMALEQGRMAEFKGKTLDEINIDPGENVHLDSDTEVVCDSGSEEERSQVTSSLMEETTMPDVSQRDTAPQQGTMTPPQASHRQSSKRDGGHQPIKRKVWDKKEILAVEKHLMSFITSCRVPGKSDCDKCLKLEKVALKDRNWSAIKFYIKNRITALKKKV